MINEEFNCIRAATIDTAWREAMWLCVKNGYDFMVKGGSYTGQIRKQLEDVKIVIDQPGTRPLAPILPPGIPAPTNEGSLSNPNITTLLERFGGLDRYSRAPTQVQFYAHCR